MEVSDQIINVLDALCEKFGLVIDWTSENVVPYLTILASKLIAYEIWTSVAWVVITLAITITACNLIRKHKEMFLDGGEFVFIPIGFFGGLIAIGAIINNIMDIIKCLTFPEMYVFEYIQNMINAAH